MFHVELVPEPGEHELVADLQRTEPVREFDGAQPFSI